MKIRTTAGQLADIVGRVARAAAARTTVPVLQGILMRAETGPEGDPTAGSLTMSATDTEISLTLTAQAPVEEAGQAVVPARLLLQYAKSLPKDAPVTLSASAKESSVNLESQKSSVTLRCHPSEDFPTPPAFAREGAFAVPGKALADSIARVLPFASKDESRPVLTGVLVEFAEDSVRMVATDSYRLGLEEAALAGAPASAGSAVVPARGLKEAARLADLGTATVEVSLTENACAFSVGGGALVLSTRLIEGTYPEYKRLLPESFEHTFRAGRDELSAALSRVALLAGGNPPTPVALRFSRDGEALGEGELTISLRNKEAGNAAEVVGASVPEGTDFTATFNPGYLADAVSSLDASALDFDFNGPLKPSVLRPSHWPQHASREAKEQHERAVGGGKNPPRRFCLIMPMRDPSSER